MHEPSAAGRRPVAFWRSGNATQEILVRGLLFFASLAVVLVAVGARAH